MTESWMTMQWQTTLIGSPVAKGSPRVRVIGRGKSQRAQTYLPKETREYIDQTADQMRRAWMNPPLDCPIHVMMTVVCPRPKKRDGRTHKDPDRYVKTTKPDIDNYIKAVFDAVTQAGVWKDDNLVCSVHAIKLVAGEGEAPHVVLSIWETE